MMHSNVVITLRRRTLFRPNLRGMRLVFCSDKPISRNSQQVNHRSSRTQDTSLIDFEDPTDSTTATGSSNPTNDLAGLFSSAPTATPSSSSQFTSFTGGNFQSSFTPLNTQTPTVVQPHQPQPLLPSNGKGVDNGARASAATLEALFGPSASSPPPGQGQGQIGGSTPLGSIMLPGTPRPGQPSQYAQVQPQSVGVWGSSTTTTAPNMNTATATPAISTVQSTQTSSTGKKDPFADLAGLF